MLDILDLNLTFSDSFFRKEVVKGQYCNVFEERVAYTPEACFYCQQENNQTYPQVLCFDQFKSVKQGSRVLSFVMMDGKTHQLLDIVEDRKIPNLLAYFRRYSTKVREKVSLVVPDFYSPYQTLVKEIFPMLPLSLTAFILCNILGVLLPNTGFR